MSAVSLRSDCSGDEKGRYQLLVSLVLVPLGCAAVIAGWVLFGMLALGASGSASPAGLPRLYFMLPLVLGGALVLPIYWLSLRLNACRIMLSLLLLQGGMLAWLGIAQQRWEFFLIGVGLGLTGGIISAGIAHIRAWAPQCWSGVVMGIHGAILAGGGLSWWLVPTVTLAYSWRIAAWSLLLPVAIVWLLLWLFVEPEVERF